MQAVPAFEDISHCSIHLVKSDVISVNPVVINAHCNMVNWAGLQENEKKFSAKVLEQTYNELNLGASSVSGIHWDHLLDDASSKRTNLRTDR